MTELPDHDPRPLSRCFEALVVVGLLGLALGLRLYDLEQNGWGSLYYAAGVRSQLESLHNFLYNAFDPGGFVSIDKPPVALWVQVVSAKLFGYSPLALLAPSAVMGTLSVGILYALVRRRFGPGAAAIAGLALALTPICVASDRTNNTDTCLVFVLLLATWAFLAAVERGSLGRLLLAAALVGVAFQTKMLLAFGTVPVFAVVWLGWARTPLRTRMGDLALAGLVLAAVSLSWPMFYDLTPPDRRPWAGSSRDNSMLQLAIAHNGTQRFVRGGLLDGRRAGRLGAPARPTFPFPGASGGAAAGGARAARARSDDARRPRMRPGGPFRGAGWGGGSEPGAWRLAHPHMAAQVMGLAPLALFGALAAGVWSAQVLLWIGWLATYGVILSFAGGIFHDHYLVTLGPPVAALAGIGVVALWRRTATGGAWSLLALLAVLSTACWQVLVWLDYPPASAVAVPIVLGGSTAGAVVALAARGRRLAAGASAGLLGLAAWWGWRGFGAPDPLARLAEGLDGWRRSLAAVEGGWLADLYRRFSPGLETLVPDLHRQAALVTPATAAALGGAALLGLGVWWFAGRRRPRIGWARMGAALAFLGLFASPAAWALTAVLRPQGTLPYADPGALMPRDARGGMRPARGLRPPGIRGEVRVDPALVSFLKANDRGERWILAVHSVRPAQPLIVQAGLSVLPIGGFGGNDPVFGRDPETVQARFARLVRRGEVRFYQLDRGFGFRGGGLARRPRSGFARPGRPRSVNRTLDEWVRERLRNGDARIVRRTLYTEAREETGPSRGLPFGRGPGFGTRAWRLVDLRPELGLRKADGTRLDPLEAYEAAPRQLGQVRGAPQEEAPPNASTAPRGAAEGGPPTTHPNVLVVVVDDLAREMVGAYGAPSPSPTPNVDALARRGVRFDAAWTAPLCKPARSCLLTGRLGLRTGIRSLRDPALSDDEVTLAEVFGAAGYATGAFGKWHVGDPPARDLTHPNRAGFERFAGTLGGGVAYEPGGGTYLDWRRVENGFAARSTVYATTVAVDDAIDWIRAQDRPWLCWLAFQAVHDPLHAPPAHLHSVDLGGKDPTTDPLPFYRAMVEATDRELGRLLDALGPALDETLVVFLGDNGAPATILDALGLGRGPAKGSLSERSIGVPWIVAGPAIAAPGRHSAALIHAVDLLPTLVELAGIDPGPAANRKLDGMSFAPVLRDPSADAPREVVLAEATDGPGFAVRNGRFKLVVERGTASLFDLSEDPDERHDLLEAGGEQARAARDALLEAAAALRRGR